VNLFSHFTTLTIEEWTKRSQALIEATLSVRPATLTDLGLVPNHRTAYSSIEPIFLRNRCTRKAMFMRLFQRFLCK
jgi:hypothetical protein